MKTGKTVFYMALLLIPLFISGCIDEKRIKTIEDTQKEILARLSSVEEKQEKFEKAQEAVQKLSQQIKPAIDYNKVHTIPIGKSPVKGGKNASVTITEFSDYQCPYCAKMQPTLKQVLKAYPENVRLVFKDYPLSFHKYAKDAARAAHAAGEQGKFWEMHDIIFDNYNRLNEEKFREFASQLKLDTEKFNKDFNSNKYDQQIQQDIDFAREIGVKGTPTFFINGQRMTRRSFEDFKDAIDKVLKK